MRRTTNNKGLVALGMLWLVATAGVVATAIWSRYAPEDKDCRAVQGLSTAVLALFGLAAFMTHVDETDDRE